MLQVFHLGAAKVNRVLHMLQWRQCPTDEGTTGLGADLDEGGAVQGRKEGSAVGDGMRRCTGLRIEGARQGPVPRRGLLEGARLRWQRDGRWGRGGDRPRMGTCGRCFLTVCVELPIAR
jgi:hypothetical protein